METCTPSTPGFKLLAADVELFSQGQVALEFVPTNVSQQAAALSNQFEQAATG